MGEFEPRTERLRDGAVLTLRHVVPEDVEPYYAFLRAAAATTDQILTAPDEFPSDPAENRRKLERDRTKAGNLRIVALHQHEMVGTLSLEGSDRRRSAHLVSLGMLVGPGWRGRGVGTCLVAHALTWARSHPVIERVALCVYATNPAGLALYRKMGFEAEGRRRAAKRDNGVYTDEIQMGLWVKPPPPGYAVTRPTP